MARTKEHKCGRCAWDGTGSTDCVNYRPAQSVPYVDVEAEIEHFREQELVAIEAELDRQMGRGE